MRSYIDDTDTGQVDAGTPSSLKDGTYTARSKYYDTYGFGQELVLTIRQGIITSVSFTEKSKTGAEKEKSDDWKISDTVESLSDLYHTLISSVITTQQTADAVTGATQTSSAFNALVSAASNAAENGDTSVQITDYDQSYTASLPVPSDISLTEEMTVVYRDGKIRSVTFKEKNAAGEDALDLSEQRTVTGLTEETLNNNSLSTIAHDGTNDILIDDYNAALTKIAEKRTEY